MLAAALAAEVAAYVEQFADHLDEHGRRLVVRNGYHLEREVLTVAGAVTVTAPRVNDRRIDPDTGVRARFCSAILPAWVRKSPQMTEAQSELMKLFFTHRRELFDKRFEEFVGKEFFASNFWVYWLSMFAIGPWHGALEMKLYMNRFVQHFGGFADLSTIKFTRLNQYDSLILPLQKWLEQQGVTFVYDTKVTNVVFDITPQRKVARRIEWLQGGKRGGRDVTENDFVLITNGSPVENTAWGDHHTPAKWNREIQEGSIWHMWCNIAAQDPAFGRPDKFCTHTDKSSYESACLITLDDKIPPYIERICQRDPLKFDGSPVTGGLVTARDSNWLLSWNVERNPHFRDAPKDRCMIHAYGTYSLDRPGNYVKKPLRECTGEEIAQEWLYHLGVTDDQIGKLAAESVEVHPCMMPYITAFFLPRRDGDRPKVVPEGAVNFGFLGQFAESSPRRHLHRRILGAHGDGGFTPCWTSSGACRSRGPRSATFVRCSTRRL